MVRSTKRDVWERVSKADRGAVELANRHYSRQAYGKVGKMLGPPGRLLCLATPNRDAVWVSHWPYAHLALDHLDAFRCTMFRNESAALSSLMIREAMLATELHWQAAPADGWITWVDANLIASEIPGWCFRRAGWRHDRSWKPYRKGSGLIRLRARVVARPAPVVAPVVSLPSHLEQLALPV
jgi:hypothetical protein